VGKRRGHVPGLGCAFVSTTHKPPLGFFRKKQLALKLFFSGFIASAACLFALDAGIEPRNTLDRLSARPAPENDPTIFQDLQEAFGSSLACALRASSSP
jgi:signal-transduction protein with cAMP-binding, CBS, and nucleotidyltransferase domain